MLKNVCPSCGKNFWNPVYKRIEGMRGWRLSLRVPHCPHCCSVLKLTSAAKLYQFSWLTVFVLVLELVVDRFEVLGPYVALLLLAVLGVNLWLHHRLKMYELAG